MRQGPRRVLTAAAVGCTLLLTGCSTTVTGSASPGPDVPTDVAPEDFPIVAAEDDDPVDVASRNAFSDLYTFWSQTYPETYGEDFEPLQGGVFSVDLDDLDASQFPDGVSCGLDPLDVEGRGAFFCAAPGRENSDSVSYDKNFLDELAGDYGRSLVPFVMAHEFGHAIQYRFGFEGPSINQETQADCFAGAWTRWVVDGNADHTAIRLPDLDDVIRGYFLVRDDVGSDPGEEGAHGSYFDRVSAIAEGYDNGPAACRDNFGADRIFTAAEFSDTDLDNEGNAPYPDTLTYIGETLPPFWAQVFPVAFGKDFEEPAIEPFDGTAPDCVEDDRDLGYCPDDRTVYFDEQDLTQPAYEELGDFAVATAISLPYAQAVRAQAGLSTDDAEATRSAVCLTGWYTAQVFSGAFRETAEVQLSPGDVDEAVGFLLTYGTSDQVFANTDVSGFELLRSFRAGFLQGGGPCEVGITG